MWMCVLFRFVLIIAASLTHYFHVHRYLGNCLRVCVVSRSAGTDWNSSPFVFLNLSAAVWIPGGSSPVTLFIQHHVEPCSICSATKRYSPDSPQADYLRAVDPIRNGRAIQAVWEAFPAEHSRPSGLLRVACAVTAWQNIHAHTKERNPSVGTCATWPSGLDKHSCCLCWGLSTTLAKALGQLFSNWLLKMEMPTNMCQLVSSIKKMKMWLCSPRPASIHPQWDSSWRGMV
ncbi:uncharacterized protein LOC122342539 [Puntigrus tetrazona]|uniref:uncharacterized protein LOC122342539 n=1 Tax=Puntigrus tetrazona TaxID=1606681 RepID=UPI001C8A53CD|nr:uncharacterized protein LOC122342539 [Puntigrus tetrazona]